MLLQPGGELLLERERDSRAGPLCEVPRAGLHQLLIEQLVEREAPPARLRLLLVARSMDGRERRAQVGHAHGGARPRGGRDDGGAEQRGEVLVGERASAARPRGGGGGGGRAKRR